ncbi:flagellar hook-length control protein [Glaciimonas sp. GNP009]
MNTLPSGETPLNPRMSIAVSALVLPSRRLFLLVSALAIAAALISMLIGLGFIGRLLPAIGIILGVLGLLISVGAWFRYRGTTQPLRIIISGAGQISIVEILPNAPIVDTIEVPVTAQLLSGSTLWGNLLLLRLQLHNGRTKSVVILADCVPENVFRAISVACRWIASRGHANGQKKVRYEQPNG